jgi:hypothetical protein
MWQWTTWHDSLDDSNLPCACTVSCIQNIICSSTVDIMAQDSSVSVVTRKWAVWLQNQILIPCSSRDFFHCIQTGFRTASAMCTEGLLSGVIPPSRSSYPLTSCILVENAWSCTFAPLYVFAVWCSVRNGISLPLQLNTFCLHASWKVFLNSYCHFFCRALWYSTKICVQTLDVFWKFVFPPSVLIFVLKLTVFRCECWNSYMKQWNIFYSHAIRECTDTYVSWKRVSIDDNFWIYPNECQ